MTAAEEPATPVEEVAESAVEPAETAPVVDEVAPAADESVADEQAAAVADAEVAPAATEVARADTESRRRPTPKSATASRRAGHGGELMAFTAKDVQALRQATGAGMMDAKKALEATDGDIEAAKQWLREQGLAAEREAQRAGEHPGRRGPRRRRQRRRARRAEVRDRLRRRQRAVQGRGRRARPARRRQGRGGRRRAAGSPRRPQDHAQGEDRARARSSASRPPTANVLDSYLHIQGGRGVNGVLVELAGGDQSWPTTSPSTSPSPARST